MGVYYRVYRGVPTPLREGYTAPFWRHLYPTPRGVNTPPYTPNIPPMYPPFLFGSRLTRDAPPLSHRAAPAPAAPVPLREPAQRAPERLVMRAKGAPRFFPRTTAQALKIHAMRPHGAPRLLRLSPPLRGADNRRVDPAGDPGGYHCSSACRSTLGVCQSLARSLARSGKIFANCSRYCGVTRSRTST